LMNQWFICFMWSPVDSANECFSISWNVQWHLDVRIKLIKITTCTSYLMCFFRVPCVTLMERQWQNPSALYTASTSLILISFPKDWAVSGAARPHLVWTLVL
jgi:hypothetical protein